MNNNKIVASTELAGAIITDKLNAQQVEAFTKDPEAMIHSHIEHDLSSISFSVVQNKNDEVHLVLPYYSQLDSMNAVVLTDDSLAEIKGGEVIILAGAAIGAGVAAYFGLGIATSAAVGGLIAGVVVLTGVAVLVGTSAAARTAEDAARNGEEPSK